MAKIKAVVEFEFDSDAMSLEDTKVYLGTCWEELMEWAPHDTKFTLTEVIEPKGDLNV